MRLPDGGAASRSSPRSSGLPWRRPTRGRRSECGRSRPEAIALRLADDGEGSLEQPGDVPQVLPLVVVVRGRTPDAGSEAGAGPAGSTGHWGGWAWACEAWAVDSRTSHLSGLTNPCEGIIAENEALSTTPRLCRAWRRWVLQGCTESLADEGDRTAADLHPQELIQQLLGFAETQGEDTAQQPHQGTKSGPIAAGLHILRQRGARAGGAAGTDQTVEAMLDHH